MSKNGEEDIKLEVLRTTKVSFGSVGFQMKLLINGLRNHILLNNNLVTMKTALR